MPEKRSTLPNPLWIATLSFLVYLLFNLPIRNFFAEIGKLLHRLG
ncbi:MAG TPA: hypothetical protein VEG84_07445 [Thermoanaerobaculia bacterium]|nr:hypothetical protein [Thermoanaerobaculia bacterium]